MTTLQKKFIITMAIIIVVIYSIAFTSLLLGELSLDTFMALSLLIVSLFLFTNDLRLRKYEIHDR